MDVVVTEKTHRLTCTASPPWPRFLVAALTLLGVFQGRPLQVNRPCIVCRRKSSDDDIMSFHMAVVQADMETGAGENPNTEGNEATDGVSRQDGNCAVCSSVLWNSNGAIVNDFTKAVPGLLNSASCGILANLPITVFLVCTVVALCWYTVKFWGDFRDITHLLSVLSYEGILLGVALICAVSNMMRYIHRTPGKKTSSWWEVLHQDYIARRLVCLTGNRFPIPGVMFLTFTTVWILIINSLHIKNVIHILTDTMNYPMNATTIAVHKRSLNFNLFKLSMIIGTSIIGIPLFASFWYYVYVMRRALTAEFNLVLVFIKRYEGNIGLCRRRIIEINHEFCLLRGVLASLMPFVMASAVLGITVHITWNYEVYSGAKIKLAHENLLINIVIFNEKFMVLILPLLAVGGLNIDEVWVQFIYALSRQRSCHHEAFWDRLLAFCSEIHEGNKGHNLTIILSAISVFLGQNITDQKLDYRGGLLI